MGFDTSGYVLKSARSAPSNATSTAGVSSGVLREHADVPGTFALPGRLVEVAADQYRAAVLDNPLPGTQEYLLWAANASNLAVLEDPSWAIDQGTGSIPTGALTVGPYVDGTARVIVTDNDDRSIAAVVSVTVVRGDIPATPFTFTTFDSQDADAGVVTLDAAALAVLGGGLSPSRGDAVSSVSYYLAAQKFWWTRNDAYLQRFGWNGSTQRWEPLKGGSPVDLSDVLESGEYTLLPRPARFSVGDYLPGDPLAQDAYGMIRVGRKPDADSVPVKVLVVTDQEAEETYSFSGGVDAVVGVTGGVLQWNPVFVTANTGRRAWYIPETFVADSDGVLGFLNGADDEPLFLCPIPGPTDRPFVRIGSRRHLRPVAYDTDADLGAAVVPEGDVGWSITTGRLKFSPLDVQKADPDQPGFDLLYLGARVVYDGVSLTRVPVGTRSPQQVVDSLGVPTTVDGSRNLFIPLSEPLPSPGLSGVLLVPDGTGVVPNPASTPATRPNGSGLVRELAGAGDVILFGKTGVIEDVDVVEFESDLPDFPFKIRKGRAVVARELNSGGAGSKVEIGRKDRRVFEGEPLYFLQAEVQPSTYVEKARLVSRIREPFTLDGAEVMAFAIDGVAFLWDASSLGAGDFDAATVAADIDSVVAVGQVIARDGRIWIEAASLETGSVEIGFGTITPPGTFATRDLSGCAALGFPPGWRVEDPSTNDNWLPDAGLAFGVFRSPQNLDRSLGFADFKSRSRFRDAVFSRGVIATPTFLLNNVPLLDVAGYDEGIFFQAVDGRNRRSLAPFENVLYDFEGGRFSWLDVGSVTAAVAAPLTTLALGHTGVVGSTLHPAVGAGQGLYLDEVGGPFVLQVLGEDYLLDQDGSPGTATLIERIGGGVASGSQGSFSATGTAFTDPEATFVSDGVTAGYRLKLTGGPAQAEGSYIVSSVTSETALVVDASVPFPVAGLGVTWEVFEGVSDLVYDSGLLADVVYEDFDHLPEEPFKVRVLSELGPTPADASEQSLSRLEAVVADAIAEGREMAVRFGQASGEDEAAVTVLERVLLGTLANGALTVPDLADAHFTEAVFSILVGDVSYAVGTNLTGVLAFTEPLPGDSIEYGLPGSGVEGQLNFGVDTLGELAESLVHYVQEFRDPDDLPGGSCEVDPTDGALNLSTADMAAHGGEEAYFVEQMITQSRLDVVTSPLSGSILFNRPLRARQLVEVSYIQADVSGDRALDEGGSPIAVTEFLPLFVRLETAVAVTSTEFSFNPTSRTVRGDVEAQVWVNNRLQNYGNTIQCTVDATDSVVRFVAPVSSGAVVQISYAVNETFGGEQGFTVSTPPVYRPPFFLEADSNAFDLETDRTSDVVPGKLLRLGAHPFYIKAVTYDAGTDVTTVEIFPPSESEAGSRAPGNDVLTLLTSVPVTTDVDGTPTGGAAGFLLTLSATYEPVDKGMLSLVFRGDVTRFAVAGHLLEVGGYPLIVVGASLSDDGLTTRVDVSSPIPRGFDPTVDAVKVSVRPMYPPEARNFLGLGPAVASEPLEVVIFGEEVGGVQVPGRTLVRGRDYSFDDSTGNVALLSPMQAALAGGQKLFVSFTRVRVLAPFVKDAAVIVPRYRARYAHVTSPSEENGLLDAFLVGTFTFASPDSFYVRTVPVVDYLGEVAALAADRVAARTPHGGPIVVSAPAQDNWDFGTVPILSQERELQDQDRAARVFISLYDDFVRAFEQVNETIAGDVVGDRDGKFRFFVGRDRVYGGPGYEDQITGLLRSRLVWSQVFEAANEDFGVTEDDPVVDPETATQDPTTKEVSGNRMNPWLLDFYIRQQRRFVLNDMDDTVLVRKRTRPDSVVGVFAQMWEPSVVSRCFPESTLAFTTTYPGLLSGILPDEPGVYAFSKLLERPKLLKGQGPVFGSTFGMDIGSIENPAMGLITGITGQVRLRERLPRARVWGYSETGFPEIDPSTDGKPTLIATPLPLKDFPLDPETGLPDLAQFAAQGGALSDLTTGDPDLSTPRFAAYSNLGDVRPQVAIGKSSGETYSIGFAGQTLTGAFSGAFAFDPIYKGIFVGGVYSGCLLTFTSGNGDEITNPSDIVRIGEDGISTTPFTPERGDTIYIIPPGSEDASAFPNPPSVGDLKKFAKQQPFLDVGVRERGSAIVDRSLPSIEDPSFPIKEIVNQRTASPLQTVESEVEFVNAMRDPFEFPALLGLPTNDAGDNAIPYIVTANTELDRLGAVQATFTAITQTDSPVPNAVYPDEIIGNDGSILATASGSTPPATLLSSRDFTPVATAGFYTPHSGVGDVRRYDVLLVEKSQVEVAVGMQGILSVGEVTADTLEVPRFVSPSRKGDRIRYRFSNAMVHLSVTFTSGVVVTEVGGTTTTFDISTVGGLFFNDGSGGLTGGLNNIVANALFAYPNNNEVTLDILDQGTGLILETITIQGSNVTGGLGVVAMASVPTFSQKVLTVAAIGFVDFAALGGAAPGPRGPFDFRLSVDTFVTAPTASTGSDTAFINGDRLTFAEEMDLRTVRPRGTVTAGGISVQGELSVFRVTASGTDTCSINQPSTVNGGDPLTFLARDTAAPDSIGSFDPSPGSGEGSVKVMAFEGHNNTSLPSVGDFTFAAVPSSDQSGAGAILSGTGEVYDDEDRIRTITAATGSLSNVVAGDVLVVTGSSIGDAAVSAGTYVVRHAVPDGGSGYTEVFTTAAGGAGAGWAKSPFPVVVLATVVPLEITLSSVQTVPTSSSGYDWATSGRLYVFPNAADLTETVSMAYSAFVVNPDGTATFSLTGGSAQDATGAALSGDAAFVAAATEGRVASGMVFLPLGRFPSPLPSSNVVGDGHGTATVGGFVDVTYGGSGGTLTFAFGVDLVDASGAPPLVDEFGVAVSDVATTNDSTAFVPDLATPVYRDVPLYVDLTGLADGTSTVYATIHGGAAAAVRCVAPGDSFLSHDGASTPGTGFRAQAGVFLEPSSPRPTLDLGNGELKVVDAGNTVVSTARIGVRSPSTFGLPSPETVAFTVRRIRRFHEVLDGLGENLGPLRFAYEIRRGAVASYNPANREMVAVSPGTQLGGFDDVDVNVNPGDTVRILDAVTGDVLDEAEIATVIPTVPPGSSTTIRLRSPGFTEITLSGGEPFEVYLRQAPVPHEQSNEQLLELITDQVILTRTADPAASGGAGEGGRVVIANRLLDNGIPNFGALDPRPEVGDIVLVDPAGSLEGPTGPSSPVEFGMRPLGDRSVSTRVDGSHIAGGPSDLDDNRGWYRVTADPVTTVTYLQVSGETDFTGPDGSPVLLGATSPTNQQFAIIPDVTGSGLTGNTEGQMDLRPTATANPFTNSYDDGTFKSIEPFSYRIIRPTRLVSVETVDLVLLIRERMLSLLEEMDAALNADKQGSYYVFQQEEHVVDLGSATDGDDGLGVPSNAFVEGLSGLTQFAPFANTSDCLSVLDRRYWTLDTRLDREFPPYSVAGDPYSSFEEDNSTSGYTVGSGRPVEPDLVEEVLDRSDRLRALRYSWIKFRGNRENGTLPAIDRFLSDLPRLLREQADLLRLQQSISDAE